MPPRAPPKAYQLLLKTHKLVIFLTGDQTSTITNLKEEALSALTSDVLSSPSGVPHIPTAPGEDVDMVDEENGDVGLPRVASVEDFELCRKVKDKGKTAPVSYETLDPSMPIKGLLSNWEILYIQFRNGKGTLLPVKVSEPFLLDEDIVEDSRRAPLAPESPATVSKGKRKAPPE